MLLCDSMQELRMEDRADADRRHVISFFGYLLRDFVAQADLIPCTPFRFIFSLPPPFILFAPLSLVLIIPLIHTPVVLPHPAFLPPFFLTPSTPISSSQLFRV
jgi:hypothetical protein